jgi:hypothetical protein
VLARPCCGSLLIDGLAKVFDDLVLHRWDTVGDSESEGKASPPAPATGRSGVGSQEAGHLPPLHVLAKSCTAVRDENAIGLASREEAATEQDRLLKADAGGL